MLSSVQEILLCLVSDCHHTKILMHVRLGREHEEEEENCMSLFRVDRGSLVAEGGVVEEG